MIFVNPNQGLPGVIAALRSEFPDSPLSDLERFAGAAWAAFAGVSHDEPGRALATHWYARTLLLMERSAGTPDSARPTNFAPDVTERLHRSV